MSLQRALNEIVSAGLLVDGVLGDLTLQALKKVAAYFALPEPNGYEGVAFNAVMEYVKARFISDEAFEAAATRLGVDEAAVRAVSEVESLGDGFLKDGRLTILFERHIFYRELKSLLQLDTAQAEVAAALGMSFPPQRTRADKILATVADKYPDICSTVRGGYKGSTVEWSRLTKAIDLAPFAAYASASYGKFQIMGFNHHRCGYNTPMAMVAAMAKGEDAHLECFVNFILSDATLHKALQSRNWAKFAQLYNGSAYREHSYDTRMANAYVKWDKELKKINAA